MQRPEVSGEAPAAATGDQDRELVEQARTGDAGAFEALVRSSDEKAACPSCGSKRVAQLPVLRTAIRTSMGRERRVIDMSSGLCPCGCGKARHASL